MDVSGRDSGVVLQTALFVALSTLALTATFLGLVALGTGRVAGISTRLPFYVLAMAIAFVGAILAFEQEFRTGRDILEAAGVTAVATFVLVTFGGEGVAYFVQRPDEVVASQLLFYFLAAGMIGTGLGYWGLKHWEDVTRPRSGL